MVTIMIWDLKRQCKTILSTPGTVPNDLRFTKRLFFLLREYFQTLSKAEQSHRPKIDQALVGSWALFCPLFWMRLLHLLTDK